MASTDYSSEIANLRQTYQAILDVSDLDNLRDEVAELTEQASSPPAPERTVTTAERSSYSWLSRVDRKSVV